MFINIPFLNYLMIKNDIIIIKKKGKGINRKMSLRAKYINSLVLIILIIINSIVVLYILHIPFHSFLNSTYLFLIYIIYFIFKKEKNWKVRESKKLYDIIIFKIIKFVYIYIYFL